MRGSPPKTRSIREAIARQKTFLGDPEPAEEEIAEVAMVKALEGARDDEDDGDEVGVSSSPAASPPTREEVVNAAVVDSCNATCDLEPWRDIKRVGQLSYLNG